MSTAEPLPAGPVTGDTARCQLSAAASLEELPAPDVVVVGGSLLDEDPGERVVHWLRQVPAQGTGRDSLCRAIAAERAGCACSSNSALRRACLAVTATEWLAELGRIGTHAGVDCPQGERRERQWPQSRAKKRGPVSGRR